jgi:F0F1-type ATP synthase assembly protein I
MRRFIKKRKWQAMDENKNRLAELSEENTETTQTEPKKSNTATTLGVCIGVLVGVALGCWLDNLALWMSVGLCIGLCVGAAVDKKKS